MGHSAGFLILRYLLGMCSKDLEILTGTKHDQVHVEHLYGFRSAAVKFQERAHIEYVGTKTYLFAGTSSSQTPGLLQQEDMLG